MRTSAITGVYKTSRLTMLIDMLIDILFVLAALLFNLLIAGLSIAD